MLWADALGAYAAVLGGCGGPWASATDVDMASGLGSYVTESAHDYMLSCRRARTGVLLGSDEVAGGEFRGRLFLSSANIGEPPPTRRCEPEARCLGCHCVPSAVAHAGFLLPRGM